MEWIWTIVTIVILYLIFVALLIISAPLHEFFHLLTIRILGGQGRIKVKWWNFSRTKGKKWVFTLSGETFSTEGVTFPAWSPSYTLRLISLMGGLGVAVVYTTVGTFLFLSKSVLLPIPVWFSFWAASLFSLIYGVLESKGMIASKDG